MKLLILIFSCFIFSANCINFPSRLSSFLWENDRIIEIDTSLDWWDNGIFYQIFTRSFADSNDDGIGDINGIISKLDYLNELGVTGIILSPIFRSPNVDFGHDVSDYRNVDFSLGTKEDFQELVAKAKEKDLKIILDMVPNHTSDQHPWFIRSLRNESIYRDLYVWRNCNPGSTPNNWISEYNTPMWTYSTERNQCYLHQFSSKQPDLMYRNNFDMISKEMFDIMTFWLDEGVFGFRLHATERLYESASYTREVPIDPNGDMTSYRNFRHIYSQNLDESYDFVYAARRHVDDYSRKHGNVTRILMTEVFADVERVAKWYGADWNQLGSHVPNNFAIISDFNKDTNASEYKQLVDDWMLNMPSHANGQGSWIIGNHDRSRVASRFGNNRHESMAIISMMLPGVALLYYGDEIGMTDNNDITWEETQDIKAINTNDSVFMEYSRDPFRTPMQWDDTHSAGFCQSCKPWLRVNSNYQTVNVKEQREEHKNTLQLYKTLIKLRKEKIVLQKGGVKAETLANDNVFAFKRTMKDFATIAVFINLSPSQTRINMLDLLHPDDVSGRTFGQVLVANTDSSYEIGAVVNNLNSVELEGFDAVVFEISAASLLQKPTILLIVLYNLIKHF